MSRSFWWVGHAQFPGLRPFLFGSVQAATAQEARDALAAEWRRVLPIHPPAFEPERGQLVFVGGDE